MTCLLSLGAWRLEPWSCGHVAKRRLGQTIGVILAAWRKDIRWVLYACSFCRSKCAASFGSTGETLPVAPFGLRRRPQAGGRSCDA